MYVKRHNYVSFAATGNKFCRFVREIARGDGGVGNAGVSEETGGPPVHPDDNSLLGWPYDVAGTTVPCPGYTVNK